jgi:hypothetical protein
MGRLEIDEYHARIIWNILLPRGGFVVVYQAYSDASETKSPSIPHADRILSVANFIFSKDKTESLNNEWAELLEPVLQNEPLERRFFHMHDFFVRKPPYRRLSDGEHLALQRNLIDSAHKNMEFGVVGSVKFSEYEKVVDARVREVMGSPFTMCNLWCMESLCDHLKSKNLEGDIAYAFEDGDPDKPELDTFLGKIASSNFLRQKYRYAGRSFMFKHQHHALGAADMLAWEYRNGIERHFKGPNEPQREFVHVLFEKPIGARHFSQPDIGFRTMSQMVERANRWAAEREEAKASERVS